ncbi:hypothetical protein EOI86_13635 [Hwanghaeella grinnelliae]|uniref:Uncharacterized protein n=1 Tax=Hwanghaeella grinnelliae TaxID=2500179 RepID=A0A3S2W945_9PROT|nr:hypothetical protein [Hwanghaeella grinnelliae]RVU36255.1 hypothetical protein EOI86_13635 [Hwanghaeella grinnelliae]
MTPQDRIDTGFAPWSLMTPDPAKARATRPQVQTAARVHEDKRAPEMAPDDGYLFGDDGLSFGDVLDIVNPLQHLPVVGALYRSITGDEASPGAKMAGGAIYGGPLGFASAMINNAIEETTGDDVMGHMLAMVGLGEDGGEGGDGIAAGDALADSGAAGPAGANAGTTGPTLPPGTIPVGSEAELAAMAMAAGMSNPGTSNGGGARQLDQAQAAFLERLAAKASGGSNAAGAIQAETDAEPLDALLAGQQTAAVEKGSGRKDYRGVARLSPEMAQHLAMLAQAGSPSQALAQQAAAQQTQGTRPAGSQARASEQQDMRAASAKYSAALPLSIDGAAPAANPFAALQAKADEPDPFETAMNRLGLNPPTVKTRGGEDTQSKVMEAAFGPGQSQTANLAEAAGITAPPGAAVPSAMMDALNRYQAMKQQG